MKKILFITCFLMFCTINYSCNAKNNLQNNEQEIKYEIKSQSDFEKYLLGDWTLNTYIEDKIFKDKLSITKSNVLSGTLSVPNVFTSKLENIKINQNKLYFEILVNEGQKPYRVKYESYIHQKGNSFVGFASMYETNELIGGFVAIKNKVSK